MHWRRLRLECFFEIDAVVVVIRCDVRRCDRVPVVSLRVSLRDDVVSIVLLHWKLWRSSLRNVVGICNSLTSTSVPKDGRRERRPAEEAKALLPL